ncbi:MAG: HAMP domain-containing sensor histidine kinase [Acidobacteriota bacterium]
MTEPLLSPPARRGPRNSVFLKLVLIMLITGAALIGLVLVFFSLVLNRDYSVAVQRMVRDYPVLLAGSSPDLETAKRVSDRLGYDVRYEGPSGNWATDDAMPTIAQARAHRPATASPVAPGIFVAHVSSNTLVTSREGGTYLFSWRIGRHLNTVHAQLLGLLVLFVLAVVLASYIVLRQLLRPLQTLTQGVAQLAEGHLDIALPRLTRDEFGDLTEAFNRMVGRVREMIGARDQLLLDVSHELRSPLTRMKVALEMMPDDPRRARLSADVGEMEAMIAELLELERLRDGRGLRPFRQDLAPLLREAALRFAERSPGVTLGSMPAAPIELDFDADKLRSVLENLLENAIKYSLPDSAPVELRCDAGERQISVHVCDDGPGIPPDDLPGLFEPFFRVDRSRSKKTGGYGLGLSICKRIVEAHGGTITVEARTPRGTCFTVTLPKSQ